MSKQKVLSKVLDVDNSIFDSRFALVRFDTIRLQIEGNFNGALFFQESTARQSWKDVALYEARSGDLMTRTEAPGIFFGDVKLPYFRVLVSNLKAGAALATVYFYESRV